MPRFAANLTTLFAELPLLERFEAAAKAGFAAVELLFPYDSDPAEIRRRLAGNGLRLLLINSPPGDMEAGELGFGALPGRAADFRESLKRALERAVDLGAEQLHVMAGIPPGDCAAEAARATFIGNLEWALPLARAAGVALLIEPINDKDNPGYFLTTPAQARRILAALAAEGIGLQLDLYHVYRMGGSPARAIADHLDLTRHIQISGCPDRHEPDDSQEIDHPPLFDLLDASGYQGWVSCEYSARAGTLEGLAWGRRYGLAGFHCVDSK